MSAYPLTLFGGAHGQLGLLGSMMLGLSMGLTACTVTCLPFMGTWVLGRGKGHDLAMRDTWLFLAGRVVAYSLLGLLAGSLGATLGAWLASGVGNLAIGLASCSAGSWLLLPVLSRLRRCRAALPAAPPDGRRPLVFLRDRHRPAAARPQGAAPRSCRTLGRGAGFPPFLLGLALSLTPCAPLGWLLTVCALSGSAAAGFGHGLAFGFGAAVTPLLLLVPLFGVLGGRLLDGRAWLAHWLAGRRGRGADRPRPETYVPAGLILLRRSISMMCPGIDNVFDRKYADHLSKGSATITGYDMPMGEGIDEPDGNVWLKAQIALN